MFSCIAFGIDIDPDDTDQGTSSRRSSLRDLRDRHKSAPSDDFDDMQREFGNLRDRTYGPAERRSVSDRTSRLRPEPTPRAGQTPKTLAPGAPRPAPPLRARVSPSRPATRATRSSAGAVGVIAGQKAGSQPRSAEPKAIATSRPILYLEPADRFVTQGEPFDVEVRLSNPTREMFSAMVVTLGYDPGKLELADADPSTPEPELNSARASFFQQYQWLGENPALYSERVDRENGRIEIRFQTPEGKSDVVEGTVARFRMVPRVSSGEVPLFFAFRDGEGDEVRTYVRHLEKDLLGSPSRDDDGALDAAYRISPAVGIAESVEERRGDYKTRLRFDPPLVEASLGEVFDVNIVVENPREVPFDALHLVLGYDRRVLKVVDYDQNNLSKRGVNIHDGDSMAQFPFTDRQLNQVLLKEGVILYRAASPDAPIRSEGVMATVRFAAVGSSGDEGTALRIGFHPSQPSLRSGLFYRGRDVLGDSEGPTDGFGSLRVYVSPVGLSRSRDVWRELEKIY